MLNENKDEYMMHPCSAKYVIMLYMSFNVLYIIVCIIYEELVDSVVDSFSLSRHSRCCKAVLILKFSLLRSPSFLTDMTVIEISHYN